MSASSQRLLAAIPTPIVRMVGRAQFRHPALGRAIRAVSGRLTRDEGVIAHGVGRGLRFSAEGGYPGYLLGTSEPQEQAILERHLGPGSVFYDIGANVGFFAVLAGGLVGATGSVWAFEPAPASAARARANAQRNGFAHVTVVEAAVGASRGRATLTFGASSAEDRLDGGAQEGGVVVDVIGVDEWRAECGAPPPTLVMIDVEGAELDVLEGMRATLERHRPTIVCEVHWLGEKFTGYVARELQPLGYELAAVGGGEVRSDPARWHALITPTAR